MTISKEDVKLLLMEALNESKKPSSIQVNKNMAVQALFGLILAAVFAVAWNLPGRVKDLEHTQSTMAEQMARRDADIKEQTTQIHTQNREILISLGNIERTRFRPEDFSQKIAPLEAKVDFMSVEQDKIWARVNDIVKSVTDNTIKIQKALTSN